MPTKKKISGFKIYGQVSSGIVISEIMHHNKRVIFLTNEYICLSWSWCGFRGGRWVGNIFVGGVKGSKHSLTTCGSWWFHTSGGAMKSLCFYNKQVHTPRDRTGLCPCELILSLQHVNEEPWRIAALRNGIQLRIVQPVRRGQYDD